MSEIVKKEKGILWIMKDNQLKQEELLQILLNAYDKGEKTFDITTNELLEDLISQIKKVYAS